MSEPDRTLPDFGGDIAIEVDRAGRIVSVRLGREIAIDGRLGARWEGVAWIDTVAPETREKAERLLDEASKRGITGFRQIEQALPGGGTVPVEYAAISDAEHERTVLLGRDLRGLAALQRRYVEAQQSMERDYWKLRQVETRYRMIFRDSTEPGVVVELPSLRIIDANPAALHVFGLAPHEQATGLVGRDLLGEIAAEGSEELRRHIMDSAHGSPTLPVRVGLGPEGLPALARASAAGQKSDAVIFVRFSLLEPAAEPEYARPIRELSRMIEGLPDAVVLVDRGGEILFANLAFADLVEVPRAAVTGRHIQEWLERPGADWTVVCSELEKHGSVRLFSSTVVGDLGGRAEIELSASHIGSVHTAFAGIVIRDVGRRPRRPVSRWLAHDGPPLAGEVGRRSLADVVEEIVGEVERELVRSALSMTDGNRTAAAELLGLSRQSLYARLDRYGLGGRT